MKYKAGDIVKINYIKEPFYVIKDKDYHLIFKSPADRFNLITERACNSYILETYTNMFREEETTLLQKISRWFKIGKR